MTTILRPRASRDLNVTTSQVASVQALESPSNHFFSPHVEKDLIQADHEAWTAVCTILITIVTVGLLLGIGAVLLSL